MTLGNLLLAILERNTSTGYDLTNKALPQTGAWQASHQQIYRELTKMAEKGLVCHQVEAQDGRPDRKNYTITQEGVNFLNELRRNAICDELGTLRSKASVMLEIGGENYLLSYIEKLRSEVEQLKDAISSHQKECGVCIDNYVLHVERDLEIRKAELKFAERSLVVLSGSKVGEVAA